jgi:predicted ATPase
LLAGSAGVVWLVELLVSAPRLKVLATSREALNLHSEWLFAVEGLGDEAVALFVQSARRARAAFELREAEAASVARICALLGTTPLAVELAAAWVRVLNCAEIAEEIERTFDSGQALAFLSTPAHDVPEGHRSMAAVFDHSWRLLSADEQSVLGRLAVFRGGFGRAAAEQVAGATLAVLSALSAKSLLRRVNAWRYDLHELVRQFAADKLAQVPKELTRAHDEHCNFYARFLAERAEDLRGSRQREAALEIAAELDNVHAAWGWAVKHDRIAALQQAAVPMYLFAQRRSRYQEGAALLTQAIARLEGAVTDEGQEVLASLLLGRGWLGIRLGQLDAAAADLQRSQDLYTRLNRLPHPRMIGDPIMALGVIASIRGDYAAATQHYEAALEVITPHGDHQALAYPHLYLASVQRARGDYAAAERYAQQAHRLAQAANQPWLLGFVLNELGQVAQARGDCAVAQKHFQAAYALREKVGDAAGMALDLSHLGQVALSRNDIVEAEHLFQRSLATYHDIGDQGGLVTALHGLGRTAAAAGRYPAAWANLTQALEIANRASFVPVTLSILVDLAEVLLESGNNERARQLVDVVLSQSNYDQATRNGAERIARRLGIPTLIEPTSPARDLAGTIAALLADPHKLRSTHTSLVGALSSNQGLQSEAPSPCPHVRLRSARSLGAR